MTDTVVFDLDGTLISNDSTKVWITRLLKANIFRYTFALLIFPLAILLMKTKKYKVVGSSLFLWVATYRLNTIQLQEQMNQFSHAVTHEKIKALYWFSDGLTVLKQHVKAGQQVIIVTAAPEILAQTLMQSIGIQVRVIGTPIKKILGGWVGYSHCRHIEKVQRLHNIGIKQPWYASYSDDLAEDDPILKQCKHAYLINSHQQITSQQLKITHLYWSK